MHSEISTGGTCSQPQSLFEEPELGYSFGRDPQCDVWLGETGGISNRHFYITFDEQHRLILKDTSTWGTAVGYRDKEVRNRFTWTLLDSQYREIPKDFTVRVVKAWFQN